MPEEYPKEYHVPQELAVAIQTDRGELAIAYGNRIRAENELAACLATIIGGLLNDRKRAANSLIHLQDRCDYARDQFDAFHRAIETSLKLVRGEDLEDSEVPQ